jgi:hypothetical protein
MLRKTSVLFPKKAGVSVVLAAAAVAPVIRIAEPFIRHATNTKLEAAVFQWLTLPE